MPTLAHKIRLDPTPDQIRYFKPAAGTLSTGEKITGPRAHCRALRRLKIGQRAITRKMPAATVRMGRKYREPLPKGTRLPRRQNWEKAKRRVARTHQRVANIRRDFLHKTATRLNAARNLQRLAISTALPVATDSATDATVPPKSGIDGKVTPVRDEARPAGTPAASAQEEVDVHHGASTL